MARYNLRDLLAERHPLHKFKIRVRKGAPTALTIDGKYAGDYDVMNADINSYYAFDSLEDIYKWVDAFIERECDFLLLKAEEAIKTSSDSSMDRI